MNGCCDWCECDDRPLTIVDGGEICTECHERLRAERAREREADDAAREAAMPRRQRMALQRARNADVD